MRASKTLLCALALLSFQGCLSCQINWKGRTILADPGVKFNYAQSGADWPDVMCQFGKEQSPINVAMDVTPAVEHESLAVEIRTFGKGKNVRVFTTGQGLQVQWETVEEADIRVPVVGGSVYGSLDPYNANATITYAKAEPIQFHFHTPSENTIDGRFFPLEAHIVCRVAPEEVPSCGEPGDVGCLVVFGVHYEFALERNMFFDMIFAAAPRKVGEEFAAFIDKEYVLNIDLLAPSKKDYVTWKGSLTTPPCQERVLWFLFVENQYITVEELLSLQNHMRDVKTACLEEAFSEKSVVELKAGVLDCTFMGDRTNNRPIQPLNRRAVKARIAAAT